MNLNGHRVLLLDRTPLSKRRLTEALLQAGIQKQDILCPTSFENATQLYLEQDIHLIFVEHSNLSFNVYQVLELLKQQGPNGIIPFVVLLSSTAGREILTSAAQGGAHFFIPKPFLDLKVQQALNFYQQYHESPYQQLLREGRKRFVEKNFDKAEELLQKALLQKNESPIEVLFLLGKIRESLGKPKSACEKYNSCLLIDQKHYDSLVALIGVYTELKDFEAVLHISKKLLLFYPDRHDACCNSIRLAIKLGRFEDIPQIYAMTKNEIQSSLNLCNYIGAGLYVTGKYFLSQVRRKDAQLCFDSIMSSCSQLPKFHFAIVKTLEKEGIDDLAKLYKQNLPS